MITLLNILAVITLYILVIFFYGRREKSNVFRILSYAFMAMLLESLAILSKPVLPGVINIPTMYYTYLEYIGKAFTPSLVLIFALVYENPRHDFKKYVWLLFIPVIISVSVLTNSVHYLFFIDYDKSIFGILYYFYLGFTYLQIIPAILIIIRSSMDKSRFSSPQTFLMILTCISPFTPRIVAIITNRALPEYLIPVGYMFMGLILSLNFLKYNVLSAVPIALKSLMDIISDAFVVLSPNGEIVDMNNSFKAKFTSLMNLKSNKNLFEVLQFEQVGELKKLKEDMIEAEDKKDIIVRVYHVIKEKYDRFFEVQIQPIFATTTNDFIATLLVFKDITDQRENIEVVIKKENLSVIGELTGGVAHDINTPITAIKSGLIILKNTVKTQDEKNLIENMENSADKIVNLVNSLKNQVTNLGSNSNTEFSLTELVQDLYVIMHSELVKHKVRLDINSNEDIWITGNTSKLLQVLNNIIKNAAEAYGNKGGIIDINIYRDENDVPTIMIEDWAGGIKEEIIPLIFKKVIKIDNMPTTGIGLYLAYSAIKSSFGGDITFDTKQGRGTRFYISLPTN